MAITINIETLILNVADSESAGEKVDSVATRVLEIEPSDPSTVMRAAAGPDLREVLVGGCHQVTMVSRVLASAAKIIDLGYDYVRVLGDVPITLDLRNLTKENSNDAEPAATEGWALQLEIREDAVEVRHADGDPALGGRAYGVLREALFALTAERLVTEANVERVAQRHAAELRAVGVGSVTLVNSVGGERPINLGE